MDAWICIGIFALAAGLRILLLNQYTQSPYFDPVGWDPKAYDLWATAIAAGAGPGHAAFHQPPLFPYLLAGFYRIFGRDFQLFFLLQGLAASLSAVLLYMLGRDLFDRRTGLLAGLAYCFYGMAAFFTLKLLSETTFILLCLILAIVAQHQSLRHGAGQASRWFGCGLLLGLCVAMKPNMVLLLPVLWLHLALQRPRPAWTRILRDGALATVGVLLMIAPIMLHNRAAEGDWVFISWNGGGNLYSGNNADAVGLPEPLPGVSQDRLWRPIDERAVVSAALGHPASANEIQTYWTTRAKAFMRQQPVAFAQLLLRKLRLSLSGMENFHMYSLAHERDRFTPRLNWFPINFYQLFPIAAVGLLAALPQWRRLLPLYGLAAVPFVTMLLFYVLTRFRMPAEPFLLIFGGYALARLSQRDAAFPRLLGLLAIFALCSTLMYLRDRQRFPMRDAIVEYNLAELLFEAGRYDEAEATYWRAARMDQSNWYPALGLCKLQVARGRPDAAIHLHRQLYPKLPDDVRRDFLRDEHLAAIRPALEQNAATSGTAATSGP